MRKQVIDPLWMLGSRTALQNAFAFKLFQALAESARIDADHAPNLIEVLMPFQHCPNDVQRPPAIEQRKRRLHRAPHFFATFAVHDLQYAATAVKESCDTRTAPDVCSDIQNISEKT